MRKVSFRLAIVCTSIATSIGLCLPAGAGDWGYEAPEPPTQPMRAVALPYQAPGSKTPPKTTKPAAAQKAPIAVAPTPARPGQVKPATFKPPTPSSIFGGAMPQVKDKRAYACKSWSQLFSLVTEQDLEADQEESVKKLINQKYDAGKAAQAEYLLEFWPKLKEYIANHPDQRPAYAGLFRALLRLNQRSFANSSDPVNQDEAALIANLLGPVRLAVAETPALTEEAVNAYADMACFLYEQKNPGKTIDAIDNRAMFAHVVAEKFKSAPQLKDKEAMAAFDLSWSKFKIVWNVADEKQKQYMMQRLTKEGAGQALHDVHDPMIESVLASWSKGVALQQGK